MGACHVKNGKVIGIARFMETELSHAQLAKRLGIDLTKGRPLGLEGFIVDKGGHIFGAGLNVIIPGGNPLPISRAAEAVVKAFFRL
jgi:hypothetical protein